MAHDFDSLKEELKKQLDSGRQNWLFGAGVSYNSAIPLMYPLTDRVWAIISKTGTTKQIELYKGLKAELDDKAHIEHYLSQLGDLLALAERSKIKAAIVASNIYSIDEMISLYKAVIVAIGTTVRYGYKKDATSEEIGTPEKPIVEIESHKQFVRALKSNRANLWSRSKVSFFTTNYDTLLEDALGLEKFNVIDGFSGGATAFWNPSYEFQDRPLIPNNVLLYKLHGSIDWQRDENKNLVRTRYGTKYLANMSDIMIFPQATKYVETQKDPFSFLFYGFRKALNSKEDNILITCGYSFGDEHVNAEINAALSDAKNRTTLIAFSEEQPDGTVVINGALDQWLRNDQIGNRVYVVGKKGLYYNSLIPLQPSPAKDLYWWTFSGLTKFILTGDHD